MAKAGQYATTKTTVDAKGQGASPAPPTYYKEGSTTMRITFIAQDPEDLLTAERLLDKTVRYNYNTTGLKYNRKKGSWEATIPECAFLSAEALVKGWNKRLCRWAKWNKDETMYFEKA